MTAPYSWYYRENVVFCARENAHLAAPDPGGFYPADHGAMITLADSLGEEDPRLDHMLSMHAVATHWGELPARERQILIMDFGGDMTQAQIGERLRISQMHVSRLRTHALGHLRARLLGQEPRLVQGPARRQHPERRTTMITA